MTMTYPPATPVWCAGCGHFGVQGALEAALDRLEIPAHETAVIAGIGCSGSIQNNMGRYGFHTLHGRVMPTATGLALTSPELTVIAAGGDGDGYAIGGGHLVHAFKRNPSMVYIIMNNGVYGLTKGQDSPTAGVGNDPAALDGLRLGLAVGAGFLARGSTSEADQLIDLTVEALQYARDKRGLAFLEIMSPCVTYWDTYPAWSGKVHDLDQEEGYDPSDRAGAFTRLTELDEEHRIPIGMIYRSPKARTVPLDPTRGPGYLESVHESMRV